MLSKDYDESLRSLNISAMSTLPKTHKCLNITGQGLNIDTNLLALRFVCCFWFCQKSSCRIYLSDS